MQNAYYVKAAWDAEAKVWCSESNIPGLVIEACTLDEFDALMMELAPEMLGENLGVHDVNVLFDFQIFERRVVAVA
jgi:Domain of unknown function (DUF1902)